MNQSKLAEVVAAEIEKAGPLLYNIGEMAGNESTLDKSEIKKINQSIDNLKSLRYCCRENTSDIDRGFANAIVEFSSATIDFYEEAKELHYINGTRKGMDKRLDSADHIEENFEPALNRFKEAKDNILDGN